MLAVSWSVREIVTPTQGNCVDGLDLVRLRCFRRHFGNRIIISIIITINWNNSCLNSLTSSRQGQDQRQSCDSSIPRLSTRSFPGFFFSRACADLLEGLRVEAIDSPSFLPSPWMSDSTAPSRSTMDFHGTAESPSLAWRAASSTTMWGVGGLSRAFLSCLTHTEVHGREAFTELLDSRQQLPGRSKGLITGMLKECAQF